ncbi:MAG: tetratricopeptide repeat protein [Fibrobacterota bacterium]
MRFILLSLLFLFLMQNSGCRYRVVDTLEQDELKLKIENLRRDIARLEKNNKDRSEEQETRIKDLKAILSSVSARMDRKFEMIYGKLEDNRSALKNFNTVSPAVSGAVPDTAAPSVSSEDIKKLFDMAKEDFSQRQFDRAINGFRDIIINYPNSAFADDAAFWVGECYYAGKKYNEAVKEYRKVIDQYKDSDVLSGAFFKSGLAYGKLGNERMKKKAWEILIERFPSSEEAVIAGNRIETKGESGSSD